MAALAYVALPISGLIAYWTATSVRTRFHGLQAIAFGALWPVALYAAALVSPGVTQAVAGTGVLLWLGLMVATAAGFDPRLPGIGRALKKAAVKPPRDSGEITGEP